MFLDWESRGRSIDLLRSRRSLRDSHSKQRPAGGGFFFSVECDHENQLTFAPSGDAGVTKAGDGACEGWEVGGGDPARKHVFWVGKREFWRQRRGRSRPN